MFDNNHKCPIGDVSILMSIYYDRLLTYRFVASTLDVCKLFYLINCNSCFFATSCFLIATLVLTTSAGLLPDFRRIST